MAEEPPQKNERDKGEADFARFPARSPSGGKRDCRQHEQTKYAVVNHQVQVLIVRRHIEAELLRSRYTTTDHWVIRERLPSLACNRLAPGRAFIPAEIAGVGEIFDSMNRIFVQHPEVHQLRL